MILASYDSALVFSHTDYQELGQCQQWLIDNCLSLHVGKTEFIIFGTGRRLKESGELTVNCNGSPVKRVFSVKYLGILMGKALTGKEHAESEIRTCAGCLSFLFCKAAFLNFECRKMFVSSLIQPFIDYCTSAWYGGVPKQLAKTKIGCAAQTHAKICFFFKRAEGSCWHRGAEMFVMVINP